MCTFDFFSVVVVGVFRFHLFYKISFSYSSRVLFMTKANIFRLKKKIKFAKIDTCHYIALNHQITIWLLRERTVLFTAAFNLHTRVRL